MIDEVTTTDETIEPWSVINVTGREAESFLQGQLSQDIADLPSDGRWSLVLAPDSTVLTSCLVSPDGDGYALRVPRELGEATIVRLRRFLLRTECTLELRDLEDGPLSTSEERIEAGRPGPVEFSRQLTPQCFGASFVASTVSFTKGCFTGQELVGRLDARGSSVPWRLVRATGPSLERVDEVLRSKGPAGPQGLTTVTRREDGVIGLGFVHRALDLATTGDVRVEVIA